MLLFSILLILNSYTLYSTSNVLDIKIIESVYENSTFDPINGISNNNFQITGEIIITNKHISESLENINLTLLNLENIYNISYTSGDYGYVLFNDGLSNNIIIPQLNPNRVSKFNYQINLSNINSPLVLNSSYSGFNVFTGNSIQITDSIKNTLNSVNYSNNCIYNISIIQFANDIIQDITSNFEIRMPISGTDSANTFLNTSNRTLLWDVNAGACLNSDESKNISYTLKTPTEIELSTDYEIMSTRYSYNFDDILSKLELFNSIASSNLQYNLEKTKVQDYSNDTSTWEIKSTVNSTSNISVKLEKITLWVSTRDGGSGHTNPSILDIDKVNSQNLLLEYLPRQKLDNTLPAWSNMDYNEQWFFNYSTNISPIIWLDYENTLTNDGVQITNSKKIFTNYSSQSYVKNIYISAGYWLEIKKNITKVSSGVFDIVIKVSNLGSAVTPKNQAVVIYNFIPNSFTLDTPFTFSSSSWYNTDETNTVLNDPIYNGTMNQYALIPNINPYNSSLDRFGGLESTNNTWTVSYTISGFGEFKFDDLFLTGVDPLHVDKIGATKSIKTKSEYKLKSSLPEILYTTMATILAIIILLL